MGPELADICMCERRSMLVRQTLGYDQHDDHVWRWLNHRLRLYGQANPIRVRP
jgi:hypothetical protein